MSRTATIVVITRDEAPRLELVLASLRAQSAPRASFEVVVVDDGSVDGTPALLAEAEGVRSIRHEASRGRSAARNAGAAVAKNDLLVFLDGDIVVARDFVEAHLAASAREAMVITRGATMHLRCTRFFRDPQTGSPMPGQESHVDRMTPTERGRSTVTMDQVTSDFGSIERRAEPGIYPGLGPRRSFELEVAALAARPALGASWMAVSGQNVAIARRDFEALEGFCEALALNEHRDLALRAVQRGGSVELGSARSYHLTHRVGVRDPALDWAWEETFFARHPTRATKLMRIFWASLAGDARVPAAARIEDLFAFDAACASPAPLHDYDAIHRGLVAGTPLVHLPDTR